MAGRTNSSTAVTLFGRVVRLRLPSRSTATSLHARKRHRGRVRRVASARRRRSLRPTAAGSSTRPRCRTICSFAGSQNRAACATSLARSRTFTTRAIACPDLQSRSTERSTAAAALSLSARTASRPSWCARAPTPLSHCTRTPLARRLAHSARGRARAMASRARCARAIGAQRRIDPRYNISQAKVERALAFFAQLPSIGAAADEG